MLYRERQRRAQRDRFTEEHREMRRDMRERQRIKDTQSQEETEPIQRDREVILTLPSLRDICRGLCSPLEAPDCVKSIDSNSPFTVAFIPCPARPPFAPIIHEAL